MTIGVARAAEIEPILRSKGYKPLSKLKNIGGKCVDILFYNSLERKTFSIEFDLPKRQSTKGFQKFADSLNRNDYTCIGYRIVSDTAINYDFAGKNYKKAI